MNRNSQPTKNKEVGKMGGCEAVHDTVHNSAFCPDLQQIINVWPILPEHIKAAIKALIQTHGG